MDGEQKKRILKRYLKEKSVSPQDVNLSDEDLAPYANLDQLLDYIDLHKNELFDLATLEADPDQWREFTNILNHASAFTPGSPPLLTKVSIKNADFGLRYWRNAHDIAVLPKDNYYARPVNEFAAVDAELNNVIGTSRTKLYALTQTFPDATVFNPAHIGQVNERIALIENQIKPLTDDNPQKVLLQKRLAVLTDLNKINQLERLGIPQEHGSALIYCTLAETTGGVTEKISLIQLATVKQQLGQLSARDGLTVDNYNEERGQYKLSTQAIIKLPKHGKIVEVQREAMALNISRLLGLDTASSTSVSYKDLPGLFVPFDSIRLLNEFATGKTFTAGLGFDGQTYTHYSTINPVGEGIQSDRFVNDFGNFLGLLFLSSDTDAIGGYNQNKALRDARSLYVFDLVVMDTHKFKLDSRLSLEPDQFFMKHTRHGQGRNRTLIEDSTMVTKYASLMQLKELGDKILQYANQISLRHNLRVEAIKRQLTSVVSEETRGQLITELKNIEILEKDAENIRVKMQERIKQINDALPKTTGTISTDEVRQALILEKMVHNPVLFSDDARPYKNPWTYRQSNTVESINNLDNGSVQITFSSKVPVNMVDFIKRHGGGDSIVMASPKVMTISKAHLNALREDMLYPEHTLGLVPETDYLAPADLAIIKDAYKEGNGVQILTTINEYQTEMNDIDHSSADKIASIAKTESDLNVCIRTAKDKGFGMHALKKFHFDAQQQLQKLMNPAHIPGNLNQAFAAALKLDRTSAFNSVVREAVALNKLTDPQFTGFLTACIQKEAAATNHIEAQRESLALSVDAQRVINHLKLPPVPLSVQLAAPQTAVHDGLIDIDPLAHLAEHLAMEHNGLMDQAVIVPAVQPIVHQEDVVREGIKVNNL